MIIGVAIIFNDIVTGLPRPKRHADVLDFMTDEMGMNLDVELVRAYKPGFYLSDGTFLTRHEAYLYAVECGQAQPDECEALWSEDLWDDNNNSLG